VPFRPSVDNGGGGHPSRAASGTMRFRTKERASIGVWLGLRDPPSATRAGEYFKEYEEAKKKKKD